MNQHIKDKMISHFTDLTKEFRAFKQLCLQTQEHAIQRELLDLEKRMDRKIHYLRGFVFFLGSDVLRLRDERRRGPVIPNTMVDGFE